MSRFITHIYHKRDTKESAIRFSDASEFAPLEKTISLSFDLSQRYCIGWHDMVTGDNFACPDNTAIDKKFDTCPACQKRTGFNPAFYNATSVSSKQEARNAEPHFLYLAYMGGNYIKVGISYEKRGIQRLLDQGARAGIILETFPTALIARQYEAKIARYEGFHETTSTRTKLSLLTHLIDEQNAKEQLLASKARAEEACGVTFSGKDTLFFDPFYTRSSIPHGDITALTEPTITGRVQALVGDILITEYEDSFLTLPLKQFVGYPVDFKEELISLDLGPKQLQLF